MIEDGAHPGIAPHAVPGLKGRAVAPAHVVRVEGGSRAPDRTHGRRSAPASDSVWRRKPLTRRRDKLRRSRRARARPFVLHSEEGNAGEHDAMGLTNARVAYDRRLCYLLELVREAI